MPHLGAEGAGILLLTPFKNNPGNQSFLNGKGNAQLFGIAGQRGRLYRPSQVHKYSLQIKGKRSVVPEQM